MGRSRSHKAAEPKDKLTPAQRLFVDQFVIDFDWIAALMRCGIPKLSARAKAKEYRLDPHIAAAIQEVVDSKTVEELAKPSRIVANLLAEASDPCNSGSERIAANRELSLILKLRDKDGPLHDENAPGGVMQCPDMSMTDDDWEGTAMSQQAKLKKDVRK